MATTALDASSYQQLAKEQLGFESTFVWGGHDMTLALGWPHFSR